MTAVAAPRLTGGIVASVVLHGAAIAAFVFLRPSAPPPMPPLYRVQIFAAPPGERAVGVVQDNPPPTPATKTPPPPATKTPAATKPAPPKVKTRPVPKIKAATPPSTPKPVETKAKTPAPAAGGGAAGGKGADVANVDTPGIDFPYPYYTNNIVRQLLLQFGSINSTLSAEVRFVIRKDGSVDPASIKLVTSSHNYSFDQRALAAVEAAANAHAFGTLPPGFNEDILPVNFRFSPQGR